MKRIFIVLFAALLLSACFQKPAPRGDTAPGKSLTLLAKYKLKVPEPSGLSFISGENLLLTVSDETAHIYFVTPKGAVLDSFKIKAEDLEGICKLPSGDFAILDERTGELIITTPSGIEVQRVSLGIFGQDNKGGEGITYVPSEKSFFVLKEKNPSMLLKYDKLFNRVESIKLDFADDVSGIFCDTTRNELWIISDESKLVACCDFKGNVIEKYHVDIPQIEGITMDIENSVLYLVSDRTEYLYVYQMKESFKMRP